MKRLQQTDIVRDLEKKMVFLAGPRQVGKTTLSKSLRSVFPDTIYLSFDSDKDQPIILNQEWNRKAPLVILDEYHKLKKWKTRLKGIFDTEGIPPRILVTGSARLNIYRRGGDSLAGRYFLHRLYPFSVRELKGHGKPDDVLEQLMLYGGFPEAFLGQSETKAARWRKTVFERVVREDIQDLEPVKDIQSILLLIELLRQRVGSPISYASLARDLEISPHTVKKWITTLENMYVIFTVRPYHHNIARSILKEPKVYFYDTGAVRGDRGAQLENAVAVCLLKHLHYLEDTKGCDVALYSLRDKEKREVDFVTVINHQIEHLIEVKLSEENLHQVIYYFQQRLHPKQALQLVHSPIRARTVKNISIQNASRFLEELSI